MSADSETIYFIMLGCYPCCTIVYLPINVHYMYQCLFWVYFNKGAVKKGER